MRSIFVSFKKLIKSTRQRLQSVVETYKYFFRKVPEIDSGIGKGLRFDVGRGTKFFISGQYERPVQDMIESLVKPSDVCYDVGANLGFFSVLLGRLVGSTGMVYAFEPVPENAAMIEKNAQLNHFNNIQVLRIACSRGSNKSELLLAHHIGGAVLKNAGVPPDFSGEKILVKTSSLDLLVESDQIMPPDLVKIDVEGAELDVLISMENILKKWEPIVIVEVDDAIQSKCEEKLLLCREYLHGLCYQTNILPNSYSDTIWFVRHFCAIKEGSSRVFVEFAEHKTTDC